MDANNILIALKHTFDPDDAKRKEAEDHLKQCEAVPGFLVSLLQIVAANEVDLAARQAGAIQLKNMAKKWRPYEDVEDSEIQQVDYPEQDRTIVKENIVETLISAPPAIQSQLASTITSICNSDFPEKWESLIPKIITFIHSQNPAAMHGALIALLMAFKKYSLLTETKLRAPLYKAVAHIFPLLLQVFTVLSANDSIESAAIQRLLCKIFYYSTNLGIPPYLADPNTLNQWISLLLVLIEKQIPENIQPADLEVRAKFPWWSAKKWAARALERFIRRYMKPKKVDTKSNKKFATLFSGGHAVKAMEAFLRVMATRRAGAYLPDKFTQATLCYLRMCIRFGVTFVALKPHLEVLTQQILFPYLCLSDADNELWQEDPVEYLRKEFDPLAEYHNPRTETINFITDLVMLRGKGPLNNLMRFVVELLKKYLNTPEDQRNYREKDGCLHAIGSLGPWLFRVDEYKNNLEAMLLVHVFPEFSSRFGFLRARACWIFSQFHRVKFTNQENFKGAVQKLLSMMHDPDLPVRVQAGLSLRFLIYVDGIEELLRPLLPPILEAIFKLMNEIESDDLVATLETIIDKFDEEMAPYAVALCTRLTDSFMKFYKSADENDAEDDSAAGAALECLVALRSLLRGVRNMPQIYAQVNPIILPMLLETLNENSMEYFDALLRILTFCTFYGDPAPMWPTFPLIATAHELWASDYIADMIPPIDNFISRATEAFLAGPYPDMVMAMYKKAVANPKTHEEEAGQATELVESMLHNCRGRIDRYLPDILSIAISRLGSEIDSKEFKVLLIEVVANALYYNPALTLQILESQKTTQIVFAKWLEIIPLFKRPFDIKLVVLGLSAIFELPLASLPPIIQQGSKFIVEAIVSLLQKAEKLRKEAEDRKLDREHEEAVAKKEEAEKKANGTKEGEAEDSDDEVEMHEIPDHQDADAIDSDDDELEMAMLQANVRNIIGNDQPIVDLNDESGDEAIVDGDDLEEESADEDDSDDEYDDDDDDDDEEYFTVIDKVDELVYFAGRIHNLHNTQQPALQSLLGTLTEENQKAVHELVELAKKREVENAQKEQERLLKAQQKHK